MIDEKRFETTPVQHIRNLINSITDGKLTITYYDPIDPSYTRTYGVSCTVADTDGFISEYEALTQALGAIGRVREKLSSHSKVEDVLTPEQVAVWNAYVRDFDEEFDAGEHNLNEIYERRRDGDELNDEEQEVLERHYEWFEEQCLKRFPKKNRSPMYFVNRAQRYEYFISQNAPKLIVDEEGRCLAEEMLLYYFSKDSAV